MLKKINKYLSSILSTLLILCCCPTGAVETLTFFHNDAAGTPLAATDANGNVLWKENYRPYGDKLNNQSASSSNKIGFAGKAYDSNTGLSYMGARYYDGVIGRFMGVDPKEFDPQNIHSFNRYAYANNNPYRYVDPDGRNPILVGMGIGALIGGGINVAEQYFATGTVRWGGLGGVIDAAGDGAMFGMAGGLTAGGVSKSLSATQAKEVELTAAQLKNVERFTKKLPTNARDSLSLKALPNEGVAAQATSPGRVSGSSAVYEKQIDSLGKTAQYTKTTYDPAGNIVHVKDKIGGGEFP